MYYMFQFELSSFQQPYPIAYFHIYFVAESIILNLPFPEVLDLAALICDI